MEKFLLVASDVHASDEAFEKLASIASSDECLAFLYAGDLDTHNYFISDIIRKRDFIFLPVLGNCDSMHSYRDCNLPKVPEYRTYDVMGLRIFITHGHWYFDPDSAGLENSDFDICINGHTHVPVLIKEDGLIKLNPGSASRPRGGSCPSYAKIYLGEDRPFLMVQDLRDDTPVLTLLG